MNFSSRRVNFVPLPAWIYGRSTPDEKAVLGALQYHFPNIEPSIDRIIELSGVSKSGVLRVIQRLEAKGWITVSRTPKNEGKKVRNHYALNIFNISVGDFSSSTVERLENLEVPQWNHQKCQTSGVRGSKTDGVRGSTVTPKLNKPKLNKQELNQGTKQVTSKKKLTSEETPFYSPKGENHDFSDPWFDEEPGIEKQISQQRPVEKLQAPPSATVLTEVKAALALPPAVERPASAQPQPQQPIKPWESTPHEPAPTPTPAPSAELAPVETTAEPKARRQKAPRFVASEDLIPAALLPVRDELLKFWAEKEGKKSDKAWARTINAAQAIQDDPQGGTEILRRQLRQGAAAGWQGLSYTNWERYGEKARPQQRSAGQTGNDPAPWRQENLRGYDLVAAALALSEARDALNGQRHAEGHQQGLQRLPGASPCVLEAELVA